MIVWVLDRSLDLKDQEDEMKQTTPYLWNLRQEFLDVMAKAGLLDGNNEA